MKPVANTVVVEVHEQLIKLINDPHLNETLAATPHITEEIINLSLQQLTAAYDEEDLAARETVQRSLFLIYNSLLADPLSAAAKNQHNPFLMTLKNLIERHWLEYEFRRYPCKLPDKNADAPSVIADLLELYHTHRASHHPLFDFLWSEANREQFRLFFKSDSALNILFFDLVALMLPGSAPSTRAEICKNLWDEAGQGNPQHTHVELYKHLLSGCAIELAENHFTSLYSWQGYTGYNVFMLGATNRQHYYKLIGAMAMTELLDPPQYSKLVKGCQRLNIDNKHTLYYREHIEVDIDHAAGWLEHVITPLINTHPASAQEFIMGATLRLQSCADYYDSLLHKMTC
ncbi:iron-containing redox enzyme family protein [Pantoea sp. paga]|uniref:iron-containing redox enzyme family protein n=1 Tax=Pantoea sp. paga TaxID=2597519 RepID=UPI00117E0325|nr:iron-containing redox enzyme family protein [Pantoea sp. paga]TSH83688.1 iron-containing redox enzyme family protein [Pantoea sp. paga]